MNKRIGLIAGGGTYPLLFAKEAKNLGYEVFVIGFDNITHHNVAAHCNQIKHFRLGQISAPIKFLKSNHIDKVVMAGKVPHVSIFSALSGDLRTAKLLLKLKDKRPLSILNALSEELAHDGIKVVSSATFLENLLPAPGPLTPFEITEQQKKDMAVGWKAAKTIAGLDIGLAVVVRNCVIVAVEAIEGTDECIKRAGEIFRKFSGSPQKNDAGMVVVKVARPNQDERFDLPVVGVKTLEAMSAAGASLLAIEARKTLILEKDLFIQKA
ncbi:MAG: UDP-2,3-diacylglucosamine diphosphatase LpxI, partial [Elusimicrobia bacterium]|nr:UDP-2,3-diacylglucosamine diphosphatase LpxI [Elusimicrobiota bacterium]